MPTSPLRLALIDLYDNQPNEGIRAMTELFASYRTPDGGPVFSVDRFETRYRAEVPDEGYEVYFSSGGPGSPFDGEGKTWEARYFEWLDRIREVNRCSGTPRFVFFICHSFQLMCRFFELAQVTERKSQSFGILPVHLTLEGEADPLFSGLDNPFFAADFRHWQVVQPDHDRLAALGAKILALEKIRPHVPLERAVMGIRLSPEMVGVQFHPEADPPGMIRHFRQPERREYVITHHGQEKYERILRRLTEPNALTRTHDTIIPHFLETALARLRPGLQWRRLPFGSLPISL